MRERGREIGFLFVLAAALAVTSGCGIGTRTMLYATNTSIGVDLDTEPPTTSIALKRQEGVIAPEYPGGQVIPVITSIAVSVAWNRFSNFSKSMYQ